MLTIREVIKTLYNALLQRLKKHRGNWEQNDPTADDYIKNRPFYTDESKKETVVKATTFTAENSYQLGSPFAFIPVVGETYKVTWDGEEYICTAYLSVDAPAIGNAAINDNGPDTGEPFFYYWYDSYDYGMWVRDRGKHTITIEKIDVTKIDERYLPDNLARHEDIDNLYDYANYLGNEVWNRVSYTQSQNLNTAQKQTARTNIGAVGYDVQALTDAQKTQARANIGLPFGEEGVTKFINYTAFLGTPTTAYEHNWVHSSTTAEANGYLEEGETYIVTWAGAEYVCTAYRGNSPSGQYSDVLKIGNNFIGVSPGTNTGEPFVMWQLAPARNLQIDANATYANQNIAYTVSKVELSKVPEPWIPDTIARVSDLPTLAPVATTGSYNSLSDKPTIPAAQVQSDWNVYDETSKAHIFNRPCYEDVYDTQLTSSLGYSMKVGTSSHGITDRDILHFTIGDNADVVKLINNKNILHCKGIRTLADNTTVNLDCDLSPEKYIGDTAFTLNAYGNPHLFCSLCENDLIYKSRIESHFGAITWKSSYWDIDTGEDYCFVYSLQGNNYPYIMIAGIGEGHIEVHGLYSRTFELKQLDEKFIPSTIARTEDLEGLATEEYVDTKVSDLVNTAPEALDTLKELSAALGDDPNFATTVLTQLGNKADVASLEGLATEEYVNSPKSHFDLIDSENGQVYRITIENGNLVSRIKEDDVNE